MGTIKDEIDSPRGGRRSNVGHTCAKEGLCERVDMRFAIPKTSSSTFRRQGDAFVVANAEM